MSEYLTVSKLNQYIKSLIESEFSLLNVVVIGEVSGLTKHYTGHFYFTLKDENSQIKCMMFSTYASKLDFSLENGMKILIKGYVGVYDKGGTYQLYCREIELYGEGEYLLKLEKLKKKLFEEGIFDKEKRKIPFLPNRIGLITSSTGAAIYDYISTIKKRFNVEVYVFPCLVQGVNAPKSIIDAIKKSLNYDIDLLVITRGGGSKEDLKVFNDESLIRFVSDIDISLISAIGHKIDTTLIDYVSSFNAITPTDAALNSVPSLQELKTKIEMLSKNADRLLKRKYEELFERLSALTIIIEKNNIKKLIKKNIDRVLLLEKRIDLSFKYKINSIIKKLNLINDKINYLNPYNLLKSGYGLINNQDNKLITSINDVYENQEIIIDINGGKIKAIVKEIIK